MALRRLRQEDLNFEAILGYIERSCLKKVNQNKPKENNNNDKTY
jgi:hypothetical protein